jgi:hypothetical protein
LKKILPFFSYLFHPLFVPLFSVILFFWIDENYLATAEKILVLIQVLIIMVLIPVAFFFMLRTLGKIDTVMVSDVSQRKLPLLMQCILIFLLLWQSITPERIPELYYFFMAALFSSVLALAFTFAKIRISLHMMAMGAMLLFMIGVSIHNQHNALWLLASLFLLTGIVASSRLEMEAHNGWELVFGFLCGIIPQVALWGMWL